MKTLKALTACATFLLIGIGTSYAQSGSSYTDFLPPSPTAGELGKYGLQPRVMSSGIPSINVPLYTFSTTHIQVPVSLSYHSDGIKVDQTASWVGLGWSLNAGGVVTRVIKGLPDDDSPLPYPSDFDPSNVAYLHYLDKAKEGEIDTEPDLFAFNFMGYSGKFVFDRNGHARVMPHQNLLIERTIDKGTGKGEVKITTPDGVQYFFGGDTATETTRRTSDSEKCGKTYSDEEETAWYLYKVVHPTGEEVAFTYHQYNYKYTGSISQTLMKNMEKEICSGGEGCPPGGVPESCEFYLHMKAVRLASIQATNYGSVVFESPSGREDLPGDFEMERIKIVKPGGETFKSWKFAYEYSANPRLFLMGVEEKNADDDNKSRVYSFEYNDKDALPARLSFSRDHWGYFNGANNNYLFPKEHNGKYLFEDASFDYLWADRSPNPAKTAKGILKKIVYPTGGSQELNYEQNTVYGERTVVKGNQKPFKLQTAGVRDRFAKTVADHIFLLEDQEYEITFGYSYDAVRGDAEFPCLEDKAHARFSIYNETDGIYLARNEQFTASFKEKFNFRANKKYKFSLTVYSQCASASLEFRYLHQNTFEVYDNLSVGGVRIAAIKNHDPITGNEQVTQYHYGAVDKLEKSSGKLAVEPKNFYFSTSSTQICTGMNCITTCKNGILHSNSINDLYGNGLGHVAYEYVTVSQGENFRNGGTEYKFIVQLNNQNRPVRGDNILGVPYSNYGWDHSLEKQVRTFKMTGGTNPVILTERIHDYVADERNYVEVPAMVVSNKVNGSCNTEDLTIVCDGVDRNISRYVCKNKEHKHLWSLSPFWKGFKCTAPGSDNKYEVVWVSPCDGIAAGTEITLPNNLRNVNVMEYLNISYWHYLESSTEKVYDQNGEHPIKTTTYYRYDNPEHLELTYMKAERSDKKEKEENKVETYIRYPDDYTDASLNAIRENFIKNVLIKQETVVNGNLVEGQIFSYNSVGQPLEVYRFETEGLQTPPAHDPAAIDYTGYQHETTISYTDAHRTKQIKRKGVVQGAYLWGYNDTKPIAEVKGAPVERIFHTSFEGNGETAGVARTGAKYHNSGSYSISAEAFSPASEAGLKMSYWYWNGSQWVFSGEVDFSRTISSSGNRLDEIRVYPEGTQMTTYTYDLLEGLSSVTDPNNITTYYTYDAFGRLEYTKDEKGNILRKHEYKYVNR